MRSPTRIYPQYDHLVKYYNLNCYVTSFNLQFYNRFYINFVIIKIGTLNFFKIIFNFDYKNLLILASGFIIVFGEAIFHLSSSLFRVLAFMFESGVPFKWIMVTGSKTIYSVMKKTLQSLIRVNNDEYPNKSNSNELLNFIIAFEHLFTLLTNSIWQKTEKKITLIKMI